MHGDTITIQKKKSYSQRKVQLLQLLQLLLPMALFITDGNEHGLDADFSITGFSVEQPLEEALTVSVTAKPTASTRAPVWK